VTFPLKALPRADSSTQFNNIIFTTAKLADGPHNLTVIYDGDIDHTPLVVKQFYVTNTTRSASSGTQSVVPTQSAMAPTDLNIAGRRSNTAAIAGGVIAGVLTLALLVGVYFWRVRRRRRDTDEIAAIVAYPVPMVDATRRYGYSETSYGSSGASSSAQRNTRPSNAGLPPRRKGVPVAPDPVVLQHEDSGVRMNSVVPSAPVVVEIPPGYSLT
jgi:hypothetical protein